MDSVCREQHDYAKGVLSGEVKDTRQFCYIRAARTVAEGDKEDDDWTQEETWYRANPSLGQTIDLEDFRADVEEAKTSPTALASFKRYSLNIWGSSINKWLKDDDWAECRDKYTASDLAGKKCYGGLDLAKTRDMTAFVLLFPLENEEYRLLPFFWLPRDVVDNPDSPEQYRVWATQEFIETTDGEVCDYNFVKKRMVELSELFDIQDFGYDPYNAEQITQQLDEEHGITRVLFPQTINHYAEPTGEFERLVIAGKMRHNGNPVLTWQAGHVQVRTDVNNNKRPVKPPDKDKRKVDGIVAAIMALGRSMANVEEGESIYENQTIATVEIVSVSTDDPYDDDDDWESPNSVQVPIR